MSFFVGRELTEAQAAQADVLLVRSVTQVNAALLAQSAVQFVGSATIGTDHIDLDYLAKRQIAFANAPGSNATSAAEYTLSAILYFAQQQSITLAGLKVGVVGYGNVGSRVVARLKALGVDIYIYDPPRAEQYQDVDYCTWDDICDCDVISAHVPLTREGAYPTLHMFNQAFFATIKPGALFINTARGKAVDEAALLSRLEQGKVIHLILDVWDHEPHINRTLLAKSLISTPHIAGYAYDGKLRGTQMIYRAACDVLGHSPSWSMADVLGHDKTQLVLSSQDDRQQQVTELVKQAYDITLDSNRLRQIQQMDSAAAGKHFDMLRKEYPMRREFSHYQVDVSGQPDAVTSLLSQLEFNLIDSNAL